MELVVYFKTATGAVGVAGKNRVLLQAIKNDNLTMEPIVIWTTLGRTRSTAGVETQPSTQLVSVRLHVQQGGRISAELRWPQVTPPAEVAAVEATVAAADASVGETAAADTTAEKVEPGRP